MSADKMSDFDSVSNEDLGRKLLICADGRISPADEIVREAGERLLDTELYANGRATAIAVIKLARARDAFERIAGWLEKPSGPDEAKVALALAREAANDLRVDGPTPAGSSEDGAL